MKKHSRSTEEIKLARIRVIRTTDLIGTVLSNLIKWGGIVYVAAQVRGSVQALAGQTTFVSLISEISGKVSINQWVAYLLGGGGMTYGWAQRRLRKRKIAELADRNKTLEKQIDSRRSSSGLSPLGTTPKDY